MPHVIETLSSMKLRRCLKQPSFVLDLLIHFYYSVYARIIRRVVVVDVQLQRLTLCRSGMKSISFSVSTSRFGTGEQSDSYKTPRGWFFISECIGDGADLDVVFKGRKPIGRLASLKCHDDPILARIIRLSGLQYLNQNTEERYIYIHGTPDGTYTSEERTSIGCVRMKPSDVSSFFHMVGPGVLVYIHDSANPLSMQPDFFRVCSDS